MVLSDLVFGKMVYGIVDGDMMMVLKNLIKYINILLIINQKDGEYK